MERRVLPERLQAGADLLLRRWTVQDAEALSRAVAQSAEHLRPWMAWIGDEPLPPARRRALIARWEHEWSTGGDVVLGVFLRGRIAGGCGLHRRIAPDGLEIGYWTHCALVRRGIATSVARCLTEAGLAQPGISHVEIHHDRANRASARIPRRLGFRPLGEFADGIAAPAETGIECRWRMDAEEWERARRYAA